MVKKASKLPSTDKFIDPNQPPFIYDVKKTWEDIIKKPPIWKSGKFPLLIKEAKYKFLGHNLISPIIISAGPASGKLWTDFYFKMGYGAVIEKTRRTTKRASNLAPNIAIVQSSENLTRDNLDKPLKASKDPNEFKKYMSITNSFGNPSPDMNTWASELREQKKGVNPGQLLGCSVTATLGDGGLSCVAILGDDSSNSALLEVAGDLLSAASVAATNGADFVELNLACPNVTENKEEGEMFQNAKLVEYTLHEFKRRFPKTPIGFKFGLYKNKEQMRKVLLAAGKNLDYLSGINAIAMQVVGKNGEEILPGRKKSGVCGKILQDIALEYIEWAAQIREEEVLKYEILGGGGILTPEDVDTYLKAGADMVQVATIALADPLFAYKYHLSKQG